MKHLALVIGIALYAPHAWAHKPKKKHHAHHKHHILVNLDDTPDASQIEPLSLRGQQKKAATEVLVSHTNTESKAHQSTQYSPKRLYVTANEMYASHVDPNFGTSGEGREQAISNRSPTSVDPKPVKLSARDLRRMQRSMRRKTSDALADYD